MGSCVQSFCKVQVKVRLLKKAPLIKPDCTANLFHTTLMETPSVQHQAPRGKGKNSVQSCDFLIKCLIHHICGSSIWTCNFCDHYSQSNWNIQTFSEYKTEKCKCAWVSQVKTDSSKETDWKENGQIVVTKWPARPNITGTVMSTTEMESLETACEDWNDRNRL